MYLLVFFPSFKEPQLFSIENSQESPSEKKLCLIHDKSVNHRNSNSIDLPQKAFGEASA
uniref:Uncharacterized protein n=1 Tax=Rhizophora mucronata TaxID=61149 RepID=A0A2P2JAU5_RHIMU